MNKKDAISIANQEFPAINNGNCNFASINASKAVWWVDPKINYDAPRWFLLHSPGFLHILEMPKNIINFKNFRQKDNKSVSIEISTADLIDVKSKGTGYAFAKHVVGKISCAENGCSGAPRVGSILPKTSVEKSSSWPEWPLPSENEILLLAKSLMPFVKFLHPDIVEIITEDNEGRREVWSEQLKNCGVAPEMYLWDSSPCAFPGIRRYAGSKEIAQFRGKAKEQGGQPQDALSLDDNDFPKQIWSFIFRGKQFQKFGPDGYSLAHLIDHKDYKNRCEDEFSCPVDENIPVRLFGLYTSVANTVYIPSNFLKPTDFDGTIRMLLQRKAFDLYGGICNPVPPMMTPQKSSSVEWEISQFDWADPVGAPSTVKAFLEFRAEVISDLIAKCKTG